MKAAITQFEQCVGRARSIGGLYQALSRSTTSAFELSDLLRAHLVLIVSAFDAYVHEIVRLGMLEVAEGTRPPTDAFGKFQVSLSAVHPSPIGSGLQWLDSEIRRRHSFLTFQQPEKVADAVRLFSNVRLWQEVAKKLSRDADDVKRELTLIVDRRNKIAHEADLDPSYPGVTWPIAAADVNVSTSFLVDVANAIALVV